MREIQFIPTPSSVGSSIGLAVLILAAAGGAQAQEPTPGQSREPTAAQDTETGSEVEVLDVITVEGRSDGGTEGTGSFAGTEATSATGLPLSIRETPQSVSVVTEQRIEDQNLGSTLDILSYTTGVNAYRAETDRDTSYSRGFWISNYIVDGMNIPTYQGWFSGVSLQSSTATIDRIEVLRGATGLLTGTGEPGAAVSITRKRASSAEFGGEAELRYGSWDRLGGTLDVSAPLNRQGTVRSRVIVDAADEEYFNDRYSVRKQTYYGTIEADVTDATRLTFSLEHRVHDPIGSTWGGLPVMFSNGEPTRASPVEFLNRTHELNFALHADRDWMKRDWPGAVSDAAPVGNIFDWTGDYPMPDWGSWRPAITLPFEARS